MFLQQHWEAQGGYETYLLSEEWQIQRVRVLYRAQNFCERCGAPPPLEIHHLTYKRLYHEHLSDLQALCHDCHKDADRERIINTYAQSVETFAKKKYGKFWRNEYTADEVIADFRQWVKRKQQRPRKKRTEHLKRHDLVSHI